MSYSENSENLKAEMLDLISTIDKHNYNYYTLDNPTISDKEYDSLYDRLVSLEKQSGMILPNSPTLKVGGNVLTKFKKNIHKHKLYSLNKCNNKTDLFKWIDDTKKLNEKVEYVLELKYDGLTVCLTYDKGRLIKGTTRGNGTVGEDVTAQIKTIKNVPLQIEYKGFLEVNGECLMSLIALENYNKTTLDPLKNARNAAAGALRNLDPSVTASRNLDAIFYNINFIQNNSEKQISTTASNAKIAEEITDIKTIIDATSFLKTNGFTTGIYQKLFIDENLLWAEIEKLENEKNNFDYLIDGLVIKINSLKQKEKLGFTEKFPKGAIAFKFEAEEVTTMLNNIVWQIGRTGKVTPTAILEPVELAGACISRATLNNYEDIVRKKIKLNSRILIRRSNEVIPEVLGLCEEYENSTEILPPKFCPSCNSPLINIGPNLFCKNKDCPEMNKNKIIHFCSKEAMNIEGVSDETINLLYTKLEIKNIVDLYSITKEQLLKLEGFKNKKADNFIASITGSKTPNLANFLYSLSIFGIGLKAAKTIANRFGTLDAILQAQYTDLVAIDGIGEILASSVIDFFANAENMILINDLFAVGINIIEAKKNNNFTEKITNKTFVITGTFDKYSRDDLTKIIENQNGKVSSSVSKKTDFVLAGENAGSKLENAKKLGVKIITIFEFENFLS